jgi:Trypsin-like peptidase domain
MSDEELEKEGLKDKERRVVVFQNNVCEYKSVQDLWIVDMKFQKDDIDARDLVRDEDVCICVIREIEVAPLRLSPLQIGGSYLGSEVGIIGFPVTEKLQRRKVHPCVLKTIVSSQTMYAFSRDDGEIVSPRVVLGCIVASGFSGGPVFSIETGEVLGMVDYLPIEEDISNVKIIKPAPIECDVYIRQPAGISFAIPAFLIDFMLRVSRESKWETPGQPRAFRVATSDTDENLLELKEIDSGDC